MRASLILGALLLWLVPSTAVAADCADSEDALLYYAPTHVNAGRPYTVEIENQAYLADDVTDAVVTAEGTAIAIQPQPSSSIDVPFIAPDRLGEFLVSVTWNQVEDAVEVGPACQGRDAFTIIAVGASVRIGDTNAPHVGGRWRMTFTPMNYDAPADRATWTTTPRCDIGACGFRVRSSGRAKYRFEPRAARAYRSRGRTSAGPQAGCQITRRYSDGTMTVERVYGAYLTRRDSTFRITSIEASEDGLSRATRIEGVNRDHYIPTGKGRAHGCFARTQVTRFVGTAAGSGRAHSSSLRS